LGYSGVVFWRIGRKDQCSDKSLITDHRKGMYPPLGLRDSGICYRDLAKRYEILVEVFDGITVFVGQKRLVSLLGAGHLRTRTKTIF
tara:strand:+ start:855 stop:1115 length:261 start_codon:yes stop_codon:yes gene_type:complete